MKTALFGLLLFGILFAGCKKEEKEIDLHAVFSESIQGQWYVSIVWFIDSPYRYKTVDSILHRNMIYSIYDSTICNLPDINYLGKWNIRKTQNGYAVETEELCGRKDTLFMTILSLVCSEEAKCTENKYHIFAIGKFSNWGIADTVNIKLHYDEIECLEVMKYLDLSSDPLFLLHLDRNDYVHDFSSWFWFFKYS